MSKPGKGEGNQHDLPGQNMQEDHRPIVKPLMGGKEAGDERGQGDEQNEIVIGGCNTPDLAKKQTSTQKEEAAEQNQKREGIRR